ncbi:hypothetical protein [Streptomyces sp. CoH17]|uniref:hypothetical protein n=1 Tax=Streptomyces sp. CoH17 TaxID=2992806 RepID=UPI00226E4179|nr:hypothetical protein [Streptomyces sp. CoH17]
MKINKIAAASAVAATLMLGLVGCNDEDGGKSDSKKSSKPVHAPSESPSEETVTDEDSQVIEADLTEKVEWKNGLKAQLSDFKRGKTGEYSYPENASYIRFKVTMTNDDKAPLDLSMTSLDCSTGEEVYDSELGLSGSPDTHLLAGKTKTWETACMFDAEDKELQVEITPGTMDETWYRTAIFSGSIK